MSEQTLELPLPTIAGRRWHRALDTAQDAPADIIHRERQVALANSLYRASARSVVVLEARA
jgi:glycogen operon protein